MLNFILKSASENCRTFMKNIFHVSCNLVYFIFFPPDEGSCCIASTWNKCFEFRTSDVIISNCYKDQQFVIIYSSKIQEFRYRNFSIWCHAKCNTHSQNAFPLKDTTRINWMRLSQSDIGAWKIHWNALKLEHFNAYFECCVL